MSSIVGLQGNFSGNDLVKMLNVSKNRGLDLSRIYLDQIYDIDDLRDDCDYDFGFGHNLHKVYDSNERSSNPQPVIKDNLVLVLDGELYNFNTIKNFLTKVGVDNTIESGSQALLYLIDFYTDKLNLLEAVKSAIRLIDGDYAFAVSDGENIAIARDPLGVKPLFYSCSDDLKGFASTKKSLRAVGLTDINTLKPEHILYNWNDISPTQAIYEKIFEGDVSKIEKMLKLSVIKRVEELDEVAVIFSGGLDSSYLALLLTEISKNIPLKIKLYAVGIKGSKDIEAAVYASKFLNLDLKICEITEEMIREVLPEIVNIIDDDNLMKVGVGLTTYFATKMVGNDKIKVAISGQGADELFGGYKRYLESFVNGTLNYDIRQDISNMYHVNLERDDACSMINGVELRLPFLDKKVVELALNIPDNKKIVSMHDDMRKSILRKIAFGEGLDYEIAYRPKKAAQYGTGIDKILRKKVIKDTDLSEFLDK